jgi:putative transposase
LVVTDVHGVLPQFLRHLNLMVAKALNVRWSRRENLWSVEQACATWLVEDEDVLAKGVYALVNPSVDDLVERVEDWPGITSWRAHANGGSFAVVRPVGFFRDGGPMPEQIEMRVVAPRRACGERWPLAEWNAALIGEVRASEKAAVDWRRRNGIRVLGRQAIRKQSAFEGPGTKEHPRRLRPVMACRSKERRISELNALRVFRRLHRAASQRLQAGDRSAVFPAGTWGHRSLREGPQSPAPS